MDPFIKGNPKASHINIEDLKVDYILLTHGHGDHVGDTIEIASRTKAKIISTYEVLNWLTQHNLEGFGMNTGGKISLEFGTVKMVSAIHSSSMPDGSYGANPVGFVIWNKEICFYISGDTALNMDMKLIPLMCPKLDFAILCIGDMFTMGYEDALLASDFIDCNKIIGCHFDTFPPIELDHSKVQNYFALKNKNLILPTINQTITF